jgi:hypothetical protein
MPIYEVVDARGRVSEAFVWTPSSALPEGFKRVAVPSRINVGGGSKAPPEGKEAVKRGYYKAEQACGSRWPFKHSKQAIKKAWEM